MNKKWVKILVMVDENGWHWTKWMKMVAESWFWFIIAWRIENRWHDHDHHLNPSGGVWTSSSYTGVVPRPPSPLHQQLIHKTIACNITNWCISNFSMQYDTIPSIAVDSDQQSTSKSAMILCPRNISRVVKLWVGGVCASEIYGKVEMSPLITRLHPAMRT